MSIIESSYDRINDYASVKISLDPSRWYSPGNTSASRVRPVPSPKL